MWRLAANQKIRPTVVLAFFSGCTTTATGALCDDNNKGSGDKEFWDSLLHKSSKGSIGWDQVRQDMGEGLFWDKLAKQAGHQVGTAMAFVKTA
jgi:hypothetical protein